MGDDNKCTSAFNLLLEKQIDFPILLRKKGYKRREALSFKLERPLS